MSVSAQGIFKIKTKTYSHRYLLTGGPFPILAKYHRPKSVETAKQLDDVNEKSISPRPHLWNHQLLLWTASRRGLKDLNSLALPLGPSWIKWIGNEDKRRRGSGAKKEKRGKNGARGGMRARARSVRSRHTIAWTSLRPLGSTVCARCRGVPRSRAQEESRKKNAPHGTDLRSSRRTRWAATHSHLTRSARREQKIASRASTNT
jgi:hypothetical protein